MTEDTTHIAEAPVAALAGALHRLWRGHRPRWQRLFGLATIQYCRDCPGWVIR